MYPARVVTILILICFVMPAMAQHGGDKLKIFGYFQNEFEYQSNNTSTGSTTGAATSSFVLQQLNLFAQSDINRNWRAFVNFEMFNSFSSIRNWGAFNLEEAWVRYRLDNRFNLKLGLQIPTFNHLNTIKNRTPLLPYIIRPLVYETSFSEFLELDEYIPQQAFAQAYGFLPMGSSKFDYAIFLGNSNDINSSQGNRTASDTTADVMVGGRLGFRIDTSLEGELKTGVSVTYEQSDFFTRIASQINEPIESLRGLDKIRLGTDLQYIWKNLTLNGELLRVFYDEDFEDISTDREFYHFNASVRLSDQWVGYVGINGTEEDITVSTDSLQTFMVSDFDIRVLMGGLNYELNDRIKFKSAFAKVKLSTEPNFPKAPEGRFNLFYLAVSVIF